MKALRVALILGVLFVALNLDYNEVRAADPGLGIAVSFPLLFVAPPGVTTATAFIQLFAQGTISQVVDSRLSLRFFLGPTGFDVDLTSIQGTILIFLNQGLAQVYAGGGVGLFPLVDPAPAKALLLSFHTLLGLRANVDLLSLFVEVAFEALSQPPFLPIFPIRSLQVTIGAMVSF